MEEGDENFFSPRHDETVIKVRNGTFYWDDTRENCALHDINLNVARGSFSMVIGQVRASSPLRFLPPALSVPNMPASN